MFRVGSHGGGVEALRRIGWATTNTRARTTKYCSFSTNPKLRRHQKLNLSYTLNFQTPILSCFPLSEFPLSLDPAEVYPDVQLLIDCSGCVCLLRLTTERVHEAVCWIQGASCRN